MAPSGPFGSSGAMPRAFSIELPAYCYPTTYNINPNSSIYQPIKSTASLTRQVVRLTATPALIHTTILVLVAVAVLFPIRTLNLPLHNLLSRHYTALNSSNQLCYTLSKGFPQSVSFPASNSSKFATTLSPSFLCRSWAFLLPLFLRLRFRNAPFRLIESF